MTMDDVVQRLQNTRDCLVYPPAGIPNVAPPYGLPKDIREFYTLCGGASLFQSSGLRIRIIPPNEFVVANNILFTGVSQEDIDSIKDDLSWAWYLIGDGQNGSQYITIDLQKERLGYCYDSFWDRHPYDSRLIAKSFSELLSNLLSTKGQFTYWHQSNFVDLGSPYDS